MSVVVAEGVVEITADAEGVGREVTRAVDGTAPGVAAAGGRSGMGFVKGFGVAALAAGLFSIGSAIGDAIGTGIRSAIDFGVEGIGLGSDLAETRAAIREVFDESAGDVEAFASRANSALGQTQQQALDGARTFGIFGASAGLSGDDLTRFSTDFVTLASDLASFNNTSPDQAITAIGAALRGESEPIRQFGVLLDEATLRESAFRIGLTETTTQALTPQQRVLAAQAEIYKQTSTQQGDFERTSGGLANQQKMLSATFEDTKAKLGTALLPAITELVTFANTDLLPAFTGVIDVVGPQLADALTEMMPSLIDLGDQLIEVLPVLVDLGISALPVVVGVIEALLPLLEDWVANTAGVMDSISGLFDFLNGDTTIEEWMQTIFDGGGSLVDFSKTIYDFVMQAGENLGNFVTGAQETIGAFIGIVGGIPGKVRDALSNAGSWLVSTGRNIIQGLIDGVRGMIGKAVESVKDVGGAMLSGVKDFLGIKSPSLRFDLEVGEPSGEGMIRGWRRKMGEWQAGLSTDFAIPAAQMSMPSAPAIGGNESNVFNITIDAHNIDDFMRVIEMVKALPQTARAGRTRVGMG